MKRINLNKVIVFSGTLVAIALVLWLVLQFKHRKSPRYRFYSATQLSMNRLRDVIQAYSMENPTSALETFKIGEMNLADEKFQKMLFSFSSNSVQYFLDRDSFHDGVGGILYAKVAAVETNNLDQQINIKIILRGSFEKGTNGNVKNNDIWQTFFICLPSDRNLKTNSVR